MGSTYLDQECIKSFRYSCDFKRFAPRLIPTQIEFTKSLVISPEHSLAKGYSELTDCSDFYSIKRQFKVL